MRRVLLISLALVLALVGWSAVGADAYAQQVEPKVVVIPLWNDDVLFPKTGQTETYGPRDDGALQKGMASPTPRFTDNGNGTVTDNLTRLVWTKNANIFSWRTWAQALTAANSLKSGDYGLSDGSQEGDWRLPNLRELQSLIDYGRFSPSLPANHPFTGVQDDQYWSSTSYGAGSNFAWPVYIGDGRINATEKVSWFYVWCVRDKLISSQ
jgi:hypothetical protein